MTYRHERWAQAGIRIHGYEGFREYLLKLHGLKENEFREYLKKLHGSKENEVINDI